MSNHYGFLRPFSSEENLTNDFTSTSSICDDNSVTPTNPSFYEFSDVPMLLKQVESLYMREDYSDVILIVKGERFPAHKVVLASRSSYFRGMFFNGMKEQTQSEVELHDTPLNAFKILLKYIYSGRVRFQHLTFEVILDVFELAHRFVFSELGSALCDYLKRIFDYSNVTVIYSMAYFYSHDNLTNASLDFIDKHADEVLHTNEFLSLSGPSLYGIFIRDSFCVSEIEIFKIVSKWIELNPDKTEYFKPLLECVRLPLIKIEDLLNVVRPTGLIDSDQLLDTINDRTNKKTIDLIHRGCKLININVCTYALSAQVIEGEHPDSLLRSNYRVDTDRLTQHEVTENGRKSIIIELGMAYMINNIELCLLDRDQRSYSYYVEVSIDQQDWIRVIDYTAYLCRSRQQLYFPQRVVKYIKIVGTRASLSRIFYLTSIKAMFTNEQFNMDPETTLLKPTYNVATIANNAIVIEGVSRTRNALLNGQIDEYDWDIGYTCHQIGTGSITIQLAQPYLIDSMRLLLWDCDDRSYSFEIDVSPDQTFWTQVIKAHELRSWQAMKFKSPIPVVFIRIIGTFNTANEVFHLVHFECPAKSGTVFRSEFDSSTRDEFPLIYGVPRLSLGNSLTGDEGEQPE